MNINLSVVIPAFNERKSIQEAIEDILTHVFPQVPLLEIVVVDDGSTDGTSEILDDIAANNSLLRVIHQPNAGHGPALLSGLRAARGENLLLLDADREVQLNDFAKHWSVFQKYDALLGDRVPRQERILRYVISFVLWSVIYGLFWRAPRDPNAPFKLTRAEVWREAERLIEPHNVIPSVLFAIYLLETGRSIVQQKVVYQPRQTSRSSLSYFQLLLACCRATWAIIRFRVAVLKQAPVSKHALARNS
jgi:glycosyltransferase involved in cell wall biosynthesis